MSARTLANELSNYLSARACPELDHPERPSVERDLAALKQAREEILDQLHSNPQLADEPMFVNAREYLLDEACCEADGANDVDRESQTRLEALRTHLRKEVRKFLAVDGFGKAERAPRGATKHWTKLPGTYSNPRILVPIDGSQQSRWAVRCAERMARRLSASVMLVHVIPLAPPASDGLGGIAAIDLTSSKQIFARARGMLPADLEVNEIVRQGSAADEIVRTAQDWRADLIVMGTHGRGRVARFLLGSAAEAVIRQAICPVITVAHEPEQEMWQVVDPSMAEREMATVSA